jgi:energy-coupling factor transport system ATP-binding protein
VSALSYADVGFAYPTGAPVLSSVDLEVDEGEVLLVVGPSGSGKSTLLRCANGLVPHSSGGRFRGEVTAFGRSVRLHRPRDLADVVGFVHQDPEAQFVVDQVEHDIAFVLENLGLPEREMRRRVEEALDALGIAHLRHRSPATLSGGERQRCAIAGAIAAGPAALVLDEPTSQLDPQGAEDVLAAVTRLNADLGTTVLLAEHRLERVAAMADRAVMVDLGVVGRPGDPAAVIADYPGAPPVTRLGRLLGLDPLPLTVRDARRLLAAAPPLQALSAGSVAPPTDPADKSEDDRASTGEVLVRGEGLSASYGARPVLRKVDITVRDGEVLVLVGRNGSGKTTLLRILAGLLKPGAGRVERRGRAAYVPQDPNSLLFSSTVRREVGETLRLLGRRDQQAVDVWLDRLGLQPLAERHPRSLSAGERQRVAIAAVAVGGAETLLLDEPTRGMDAASRLALERAVTDHASAGGAVVLATHDIELAARCATSAIVLGDGDVVAHGPARDVLSGSLFAPQVRRALPPFLTVEEVAAHMAGSDEL